MGMAFICQGDLDREQLSVLDFISLYGVTSDWINRYVHDILEQKKSESKTGLNLRPDSKRARVRRFINASC